jgi:hypothetical protein
VLNKLANASKKGGASYLEGVVGALMSVYSKANGYLPITGDLKEELKSKLLLEYAQVEKKLEKLPEDTSSDTHASKARRSQRCNHGKALTTWTTA